MRELHKKNMLIVEIGVLLLIIMTFVSYGVSVKSYIGTAILILCGLLVFVGYKYIKNDLATALMITVNTFGWNICICICNGWKSDNVPCKLCVSCDDGNVF